MSKVGVAIANVDHGGGRMTADLSNLPLGVAIVWPPGHDDESAGAGPTPAANEPLPCRSSDFASLLAALEEATSLSS